MEKRIETKKKRYSRMERSRGLYDKEAEEVNVAAFCLRDLQTGEKHDFYYIESLKTRVHRIIHCAKMQIQILHRES